jgi:hypothetical protein
MKRMSLLAYLLSGLMVMMLMAGCEHHHRDVPVTTYHYDNLRTGWNDHERRLKPGNVSSSHFGLLYPPVTLDDQVDAQPLVVPDQRITTGPTPGRYDVVYVATESNTVYAIDAATGSILLSANFGPPVPLPLGCGNNGPNVGIDSTPVIDLPSRTLYVMVYTLESGNPAYRLHALDLATLGDRVAPVLVSASHLLSNGTTYTFDATFQRQRPALVLAFGNVYAGFGSFCDFSIVSRGWLLGWSAASLTPLAHNQLNDTQPVSFNVFLSSIWMSGFGVAADRVGNLYFVTGNSYTPYDGITNIQESIVKTSADLTAVVSLFTPFDQPALDAADWDFGSGGALLLPDQPGPTPHLAAAAGKKGDLYFVDRKSLGGFTPGGPDKVVGQVKIGSCWCGQSFFAHHGHARVVSSGGSEVTIWKLQTAPAFAIAKEASSSALSTGQDPGFFTSVSSDGSDDAIVWAVSRPINSSPANVLLYAFDAQPSGGSTTLTQLFSGVAGNWPNTGGNANIVPVVADGRVFVASNQQLAVFGLK